MTFLHHLGMFHESRNCSNGKKKCSSLALSFECTHQWYLSEQQESNSSMLNDALHFTTKTQGLLLQMLWKLHVDGGEQQGGFLSVAGSHSCTKQRISPSSKAPGPSAMLVWNFDFILLILCNMNNQAEPTDIRSTGTWKLRKRRISPSDKDGETGELWGVRKKDMKAWVQKGSLSSGENIIQSTPWVYSLQALVHIGS